MKLGFRDIAPFLARPDPAVRMVVIYGPEAGLVQERAQLLTPHYIDMPADPMAITGFTGTQIEQDPAAFLDETQSISLLGPTRRLLKITQAEDGCTPVLKDYLANPNPDIFVMVLAGNLSPKSLLRLLAEKDSKSVALPCYVENEQELQGFIAQFLQSEGYTADKETTGFLASNLIGDRLLARRQLEKILLYKGVQDKRITVDDVRAAIPDLAQQTLDDVVYSAFDANWPVLFRALDGLLGENTSFMLILRSLQNHARRLEQVHMLMAEGQSLDIAMKSLHPAVFFKVESQFKGHIGQWSIPRLQLLQQGLLALETSLKTYGTDMTAPLLGQWLLQNMSLPKAA